MGFGKSSSPAPAAPVATPAPAVAEQVAAPSNASVTRTPVQTPVDNQDTRSRVGGGGSAQLLGPDAATADEIARRRAGGSGLIG